MRRTAFVFIVLSFLLAGCFRDAGEDRAEVDQVSVATLFTNTPLPPTLTPTDLATIIPTLTYTPQVMPTNTFPVGGPPIVTSAVTSTPAPNVPSPTTALIPSFTPAVSTFGDAGITPTTNFPTQPAPNALITPTAFATDVPNPCIYTVQSGDTLFRIATNLNVTPDEMLAVNPDLAANPNALQVGQTLNVPNCGSTATPIATVTTAALDVTPGVPTSAPATTTGQTTYTVQDGDNLFRIAVQFNTTVDAIVAANPDLGGGTIIYPGQVLVIPAGQ